MFFRILAIFTLFTPLFFPSMYVVILAVIASFRYPVVVLAVGIEMDVFYYVHSTSFFYGTLFGFLGMVFFILVRKFTRYHTFIS